MKHKGTFITILIIILILLGVGYWYFFMNGSSVITGTGTGDQSSGFSPFGRTPAGGGRAASTTQNTSTTTNNGGQIVTPVPILRLLSNTPIGGYGATTTASTTFVRWIDRGRGNIYEVDESQNGMNTLSNTVLPRVYESVWNKNLTAFIGSMLTSDTGYPTTVYAALLAQATSSPAKPVATKTPTVNSKNKSATSTATTTKSTATTTASISSSVSTFVSSPVLSLTPFDLRGQNLPDNVIAFASSPKKDRVFLLINEQGRGVGYISAFNATGMTKIFDTPLTQVTAEWPTDASIAITTKGSSDVPGFLYLVDVKTGAWKRVAGPLPGLSARVSHDGKYAFISATSDNNNVITTILNIAKGTGGTSVIATMADKCVWGNFYPNIVYCAVPSQTVEGVYPDDWYKGTLTTSDKIWQMNAVTGEINLISNIVDRSDRVIDAFGLGLDSKDNYLFFENKQDLSFWSLDLVRSK